MNLKAFLIIGLVLSIITMSGCTSDPDDFKIKHFENENISFDYPESWKVTVTQNPADIPLATWMINIRDHDPSDVNVRIFEFENGSPELFANPSPEELIDPITIDGIKAQGSSPDKYTKMYIFFKNNTRYQVLLYATGSPFDEYKSQINSILNSIHIK